MLSKLRTASLSFRSIDLVDGLTNMVITIIGMLNLKNLHRIASLIQDQMIKSHTIVGKNQTSFRRNSVDLEMNQMRRKRKRNKCKLLRQICQFWKPIPKMQCLEFTSIMLAIILKNNNLLSAIVRRSRVFWMLFWKEKGIEMRVVAILSSLVLKML